MASLTVPQAFDQLLRGLELTEREQSEATRQSNALRDKLRASLAISHDFLSGCTAGGRQSDRSRIST
ncbi:hypothetical protein NAEX_07776 [Nannocystis exedens]|nr:hypothetical protein NAEX_07776 [Nannocystis exedens]